MTMYYGHLCNVIEFPELVVVSVQNTALNFIVMKQ